MAPVIVGLPLGSVLANTCEVEGNVDYSSRVSFTRLVQMYMLIGSFVIVSGLSALVAWVLAKVFRLSRSQTYVQLCPWLL